jgi:hypothetical protein
MYLAFTLLNKRHIFLKKIVLSVFLNLSLLVIKFRFLSVSHNDSKWSFAYFVLTKKHFVYTLICKKDFACFLFH